MTFPNRPLRASRPWPRVPRTGLGKAMPFVRAAALSFLVFSGLVFSTSGVCGQTGHQASATLRITVNVVPTVQTGLSGHRGELILRHPMTPPSVGGLLVWPERTAPLTSIEEVRKLSDSPWEWGRSAIPAISGKALVNSGGYDTTEFSALPAQPVNTKDSAHETKEPSNSLILTRTIVPQ